MDLLDRDPPRSDTIVQIAADSVGALTGGTPATETAIAAAMPGFTTGSVLIGLETETTNAIVLYKSIASDGAGGGQTQLLDIVAGANGKIKQIQGVSHHVAGPGGERPGMTLAQTGTDESTCRPGTALWIGMAVCRSRAAANVALLFSLMHSSTAAGALPPRADLDKGELQRIVWTPPA